MYRTKLLYWKKINIIIVALCIFFQQCTIEPVQPSFVLTKGLKLSEPALINNGVDSAVIDVGSSFDNLLKNSKLTRPVLISEYGNKGFDLIRESIKSIDLMNHPFTWKTTNRKNMMVAIFKQVIKVNDSEISNKEDIVWIWTPQGIDTGKIKFSDGQRVSLLKENFVYSKAQNLNPGFYVWCIWAWDDQGVNIITSSRELPFEVKD